MFGEGGRQRWPRVIPKAGAIGGHSTRAHFWCGLVAGVGVGLLLGAALVELEALTSQRKAWVSLLGAVLVGVGGLVGWRRQSSYKGEAEPALQQGA